MADTALLNAIECECAAEAPAGVWWRIGIGAFLAMNGMVMSLAVNGSEVTPDERRALEISIFFVSLSVIVLLVQEFAQAAWANFRQRRMGIEFLFLLGITACLGASVLSLTTGTGASYSDVAAMLLVIYSLGRQIGAYGKSRVLAHLRQWAPGRRFARTLGGEKISAAQIRRGDAFRVFPGEAIPVDAVVTGGGAFVHESSVTGEAAPVSRAAGEQVSAGSYPIDASLECRAVTDGDEASVDTIRALVLSGIAKPGREQRMALAVLRWFTPAVLLTALGTFLWHSQRGDWPTAAFHALSVIVVACPCALGFATPLAIWTAIARLREYGLIARTGEAVEKLAETDTIVFDKTGTLTLPERYEVSWDVAPTWRGREDELRFLLREAECASNHPLAIALKPLWENRPLAPAAALTGIQLRPGRGLEARFADGRTLELEAGRNPNEIELKVQGESAALLTLGEVMDPTAIPALRQLEEAGVRVLLATGDAKERAALVPIREQLTRQSATDKHELLKTLKEQGAKTLFVGDGLNDVAAMAWSDVACTAHTSPELVREVGGLILAEPDWQALPRAIAVAKAARTSIRVNIFASLAYNAVGMGLAAAGILDPVAAALIMLFSSLTVILQSSRLFDWQPNGETQ
jgi:cation transport ATPase